MKNAALPVYQKFWLEFVKLDVRLLTVSYIGVSKNKEPKRLTSEMTYVERRSHYLSTTIIRNWPVWIRCHLDLTSSL